MDVTVTRELDRELPRLCAYGGELNQVWTNLIDNAVDTVSETGRIDIRRRRDGEFFLVEIGDNGDGIPPKRAFFERALHRRAVRFKYLQFEGN
jgi:signal transduction histidine kinase